MACLAIQVNAIFVTITEVQLYAWAGQPYQGPGTDFTSFVWQHTARRKQGQLQLLAMWALPGTPLLHGRLPGGTEPSPAQGCCAGLRLPLLSWDRDPRSDTEAAHMGRGQTPLGFSTLAV